MSSSSRSGCSSKICSGVIPSANNSSTSLTRIRMPLTHGRPPHWRGFTVIRSKICVIYLPSPPYFTIVAYAIPNAAEGVFMNIADHGRKILFSINEDRFVFAGIWIFSVEGGKIPSNVLLTDSSGKTLHRQYACRLFVKQALTRLTNRLRNE